MPPADNDVGAKRLSNVEAELLKTWIAAGAKDSISTPSASQKVLWLPLPKNLKPIYGIDESKDGQHLAFGHGNSIRICDLDSGNTNDNHTVLSDPTLGSAMIAHRDVVHSLAFSPDSQRLATGGFRCVKIWRRSAPEESLLNGLAKSAEAIAFSPTKSKVAYARNGSALEIIDLESQKTNGFLAAHDDQIVGIVWVDDSTLLSCDAAGKWSRTDGLAQTTKRIRLESNPVASRMVRLPYERSERVLGIREDGSVFQIRLHQDVEKENPNIEALAGYQDVVDLSLIESEQSQVALLMKKGDVVILDAETLQQVNRISTGKPRKWIEFDKAGTKFVAADGNSVELWDFKSGTSIANLKEDYDGSYVRTKFERMVGRHKQKAEHLGKRLKELETTLEKEREAETKSKEAHDKAVSNLAKLAQEVAAASEAKEKSQQALDAAQAIENAEDVKKKIESAQKDVASKLKSLKEVEAKRQKAEQELAERKLAVATATESVSRATQKIPAHEVLIANAEDRLKSLLNEQAVHAKSTTLPTIKQAVFTDANQVALLSNDHVLRIYSSFDGSPIANVELQERLQNAISDRDETMIAIDAGGHLRRWNLAMPWALEQTIGTGEESPFSDRITALDFSPDGERIVVGSGAPSRSGDLYLVAVDSGKVLFRLDGLHEDTVFAAKFSPSGKQLVSAGADKLCRLMDAESGQVIRTLEGHTHHVLSVAWDDVGQSVASASTDATIKIWDIETGQQKRTIKGFTRDVTSIAYLGDTQHLVSTLSDGTVQIHNATDGKRLRQLSGAEGVIFAAGVSSDGQRVSVGGEAGQIWSWQTKDGKRIDKILRKK